MDGSLASPTKKYCVCIPKTQSSLASPKNNIPLVFQKMAGSLVSEQLLELFLSADQRTTLRALTFGAIFICDL